MEKREHPYWRGYYAAKNGSVFGQRVNYLKPILHHTGYTKITLRTAKKQKQVSIHRFVWETFNGEIPKDKVINHKDGDKTNNSLDNLELISNKENTIHAYKIGLMKGKTGATNPQAKLSKLEATNLILDIVAGINDKTLSKKYGLHRNYVSYIRNRKRWRSLWEELESSTTIPNGSTSQVNGDGSGKLPKGK